MTSSSSLLNVVSFLATVNTIFLFYSPLPTIRKCVKTRTVGQLIIDYYCFQFISCVVWFLYGVCVASRPIIIVNLAGVISASYLVNAFLSVLRDEEKVPTSSLIRSYRQSCHATCASLGISVCFIIFFALCQKYQTIKLAETLLGVAGGLFAVMMFTSPLSIVRRVIQTRNSSVIQPVTLLFCTISATLWTLYGLLASDMFVLAPNSLCILSCLVQWYLVVRYNSTTVVHTLHDSANVNIQKN